MSLHCSRALSLERYLALFVLAVAMYYRFVDAFSTTRNHQNTRSYYLPAVAVHASCSRNLVKCFAEVEDEWESLGAASDISNNTTAKTIGYRRIEDWHDETHDPNHVIEHLKREQARWSKTFEDLGGDGI